MTVSIFNGMPTGAERVTKAQASITTDHAFIHEGIAFSLTGSLTVANNQTGAISIAVPAGCYCHFKPANLSTSAGPLLVSLLEDSSFTGGTAATANNRNRVRAATASVITCKALANATIVAGAAPVTLDTVLIPGQNSANSKLGGSSQAAEEWVLKPNTNYLMAFGNTSGGAITVGYELFWYEEGGA